MQALAPLAAGKPCTPEEFIAFAHADDASKKPHALVYSPWGSVNTVNMNADSDEGSFACAEGGDAHFSALEALAFPGVRLIAILSNATHKYDAYSTRGSRLRGFYDVLHQLLYGKEVAFQAVGLVWTYVGCSLSPRDLSASVLCLDLGTDGDTDLLTECDVCDMKGLLPRLSAPGSGAEEQKRHRAIWVAYLVRFMERARWARSPEDVADEVFRFAAIVEAGHAVFPGSLQEAYADVDVLSHLTKPCQLSLFSFHLDNGAAQHITPMNLESLHIKLYGSCFAPKAKYTACRSLLSENEKAHTAWLASKRLVWIESCLQGGIKEEATEGDAQAEKKLRFL